MADDHDDDNENVHNSVVVKYQKLKYERLLELDKTNEEFEGLDLDLNEIEVQRCLYSIKELLNTKAFKDLSEDSKLKVLHVLSVLKDGNETIISLTDKKEDNGDPVPILCISVFNIVYRRINNPANSAQKAELEKMLLDKLVETVKFREENDNDIIMHILFDAMNAIDSLKFELVCPYGIISNIIDSLTLLDVDEILAAPVKDMCELRNEAYLTAYRILDKTLEAEDMTELYNKDDKTLTDAEIIRLKKFEQKVKLRIKKQLTADYDKILNKKKLNKIIKDSFAGCCL